MEDLKEKEVKGGRWSGMVEEEVEEVENVSLLVTAEKRSRFHG